MFGSGSVADVLTRAARRAGKSALGESCDPEAGDTNHDVRTGGPTTL